MNDRVASERRTEDRIRGDKIHAMESNVPKSLFGYLAAAAFATYYVHAQWPALLRIWVPLLVVTCLVRSATALRISLARPRPLSAGYERFLMVFTSVVSAVLTVGPTWIALHSDDGFTSALMVALVISAMWGGALVQAPVLSSAVGYVSANFPVWLLCIGFSEPQPGRIPLALMFFATIGVAIDNLVRYARGSDANLRQKIDLESKTERLEQQAEVIGLLLREHEDQSSDWLWQIDAAGRLQQPSVRFAEVFGVRLATLQGSCLLDRLKAEGVSGNAEAIAQLDRRIAGGRSFRDLVVPGALNGQPRWWSLSGKPIRDEAGSPAGFRGVMGDVTAARQAQAHVDYLAHHDPLTGLANRIHFGVRVRATLEQNGERAISIVSVDLDGFKPVNDRFGHPVGDELLATVAREMRLLTDANGLVARLGGDEFAVALPDLDPVAVQAYCRRLLQAIAAPKRIGTHDVVVGASIGVAVAPADGRTVEELLRNADAALYRAKREGRGQCQFFEPGMDRQIQLRNLLLQDLRDAVQQGLLSLHYQPYVDSGSGQVTGCEALLRWQHPVRGAVSPAEFIPIAEESGLIVDIGRWVIDRACATAAGWPPGIRVSVNLSPRQFKDRGLPAWIADVIRRHGLAPSRLEVEVTEAVLIDDAQGAMEILSRIREIGIKVSLDDFGTGYSSLSYLRDFRFDKIKIDRSFVSDIESRKDSRVIVSAVQAIAHGLGMTITAEGVETASQARLLRSLGCHELQGFLFSKAQPDAVVAGLLRGKGLGPLAELTPSCT